MRQLTASDAQQLLAGCGDFYFVNGYPSAFVMRMLCLVVSYSPSLATSATGPWLVLRHSDNAVVGAMSCAAVDHISTVAVGYEIAPGCEGQGYATEALKLLVGYLFADRDVWRICAYAAADHVASRRVMEKAGMRWQRDQVEILDGRQVTVAHYAIDRRAD
ncbi:MAG: GNAT family N-acetyltransferase [Pseudonocardia sp.]|nr:GNAT family N-acetyltransferase [Pseudonocardia sp.]